MPKFHFHIRDDVGLILDDEGMVLPDLDAARQEAHEDVREMLADALRAHKEVDSERIEIANENGEVIETFKLRGLLS